MYHKVYHKMYQNHVLVFLTFNIVLYWLKLATFFTQNSKIGSQFPNFTPFFIFTMYHNHVLNQISTNLWYIWLWYKDDL